MKIFTVTSEHLAHTKLGAGAGIIQSRVTGIRQVSRSIFNFDPSIESCSSENQTIYLIFIILLPDEHIDNHFQSLSFLAKILQRTSWSSYLKLSKSDQKILEAAIKLEKGDLVCVY